ncbi:MULTISPECIES: anaerobic ribonucleoside-triphosphate reductase activating protein [Jonquetella]|uniref:Anaerobic ribonucleoside-triphosphate reductase activating protein n=1 Tax=Jonquetella anthropi DSM 22815 TaxID=885272 RepID=H0UM49_9BACT|nr:MULTISPECIES: anaerobic ribonucleoside-triphosphate reductase activating protein [Jonquetella]EEX48179.1 anaerobic ribonucleoside-triphosphate reductase activating protein [Jonquetella anthropi E3_33 E1]EHM13625.1 anaerobic ribonucleoside-triphosphate reductase activating protein [Jonquetella anthropi DSM 22815]ERL24394.1 anaerobic ribonucleoside-triphosphate reductase activating protein [Jonquetella sp. BV3C21]
MLIGGLQRTSLIDYPGLVAATVFTLGCNFRCPWCHNGPLVDQSSDLLDEEDFFSFLASRKRLLDGVVVTGGEPTIHRDLPEFILRIKDMGLKVKLDTNGSHPAMMADLIDKKLVDYIAMDVKAAPSAYRLAAGTTVQLETLRQAIEQTRRLPHEFRLTLVPGIHTVDSMDEYAQFLVRGPLYLQAFRPVETVLAAPFRGARPFTPSELAAFRDRLASLMEGPVVLRSAI